MLALEKGTKIKWASLPWRRSHLAPRSVNFSTTSQRTFRLTLPNYCSSHSNQNPYSTSKEKLDPDSHWNIRFVNMAGETKKEKVSRFLQESQEQIFVNNRAWVASKVKNDEGFFEKLSSGQHPDYL